MNPSCFRCATVQSSVPIPIVLHREQQFSVDINMKEEEKQKQVQEDNYRFPGMGSCRHVARDPLNADTCKIAPYPVQTASWKWHDLHRENPSRECSVLQKKKKSSHPRRTDFECLLHGAVKCSSIHFSALRLLELSASHGGAQSKRAQTAISAEGETPLATPFPLERRLWDHEAQVVPVNTSTMRRWSTAAWTTPNDLTTFWEDQYLFDTAVAPRARMSRWFFLAAIQRSPRILFCDPVAVTDSGDTGEWSSRHRRHVLQYGGAQQLKAQHALSNEPEKGRNVWVMSWLPTRCIRAAGLHQWCGNARSKGDEADLQNP